MAQKSGTLFYGDPHDCWQPLLDEYAGQPSKAVVLLGDCELAAPLNEVLKPIAADETPVFWINGYHDMRRIYWWSNLTATPGGLYGRVTEVAGLRLAGLGGNLRGESLVSCHRRQGTPPPHATRHPARAEAGATGCLGHPRTAPGVPGRIAPGAPRDDVSGRPSPWRRCGPMCSYVTRLPPPTLMVSEAWMTWPRRWASGSSCTGITITGISGRPGTESRCGGWAGRSAGGWRCNSTISQLSRRFTFEDRRSQRQATLAGESSWPHAGSRRSARNRLRPQAPCQGHG